MAAPVLVAGVDCSTQATKVVVRHADSGELVRSGHAAHPPGTEIAPEEWWSAFEAATTKGLLEGVSAIAVGGQQHGMVCLDEAGEVIRPALLWNDTRSAAAADELVSELGGPAAWAQATGSVPLAAFTVTKLRWLAEHEPAAAKRVCRVVLPHDWLTWRLAGGQDDPVTDRGDASGTGYWSPATGDYRMDLLERALGRAVDVPRVLGPAEAAGRTPDGAVLGPGTGDNMAAALGIGAGLGDVIVSLGTSGTAFAVHDAATADASGAVAGFADATGRFLPLVCTLNAARVLDATASLLGTDHTGLSDLAMSASPGSDGLVLLPYLEGERTPNRPDATGLLAGLKLRNATRENLARAAVEGMLCGLADALDALRAAGIESRRILLIGGAARSAAVQHVASAVFGLPVTVAAPGEYVADGAARQAAWVLAGGGEPPDWLLAPSETVETDPTPQVRAAYAEVRDATS
ncbi:MAG: xylulokinase [Mycobacteriales bacterium]